jgi:hypothetical protein
MNKKIPKIDYSKLLTVFTETKYSFEGQLPDEKVIKVVRRHWFTLVAPFGGIVFLAFLPLPVYAFLSEFISGQTVLVYWFLTSLFYLFLWYVAFFKLLVYLMDMWIITNHRIIDTELFWLFSRSVAELNLKKIQDISVDIHGMIPTMLNFGNVEVQTAGPEKKFQIGNTPNPAEVKNAVMKAYNAYKHLHPQEPTDEPV